MDARSLRHPKEKTYFGISVFFAILLHVGSVGILLVLGLLMAIPLWISGKFFRALVFGDAVKVSEKQFSAIFKIIQDQSRELQLKHIPDVFIYNGQGMINALAIRFLSSKYVILMSSLVDLMLKRKAQSELEMIIGHELAHHALGHTSNLRSLLLFPSRFIPFLPLAYSRGCEYSSDRIGFELTKDKEAAARGLLSLALGSESLANSTDINEFITQESQVPGFFGFMSTLLATHPRMTRRVRELLPLVASSPSAIKTPVEEVVRQPIDESRYMPK